VTVSITRTHAGSYTVIGTKSFTCGVSSLPGLFGGTLAVMRANAEGEIVKWPLVAKARLRRGMTKEQRDAVHDDIAKGLDELGTQEIEDFLGRKQPISLPNAIEGTFSVAKAQGQISSYDINKQTR
jgi:hypothetical protein